MSEGTEDPLGAGREQGVALEAKPKGVASPATGKPQGKVFSINMITIGS